MVVRLLHLLLELKSLKLDTGPKRGLLRAKESAENFPCPAGPLSPNIALFPGAGSSLSGCLLWSQVLISRVAVQSALSPGQSTAWGYLPECWTLCFFVIEPHLRFLHPRTKPGFIVRHRGIVCLDVWGDSKASLIHCMEVVAHLAAFPPDLLLEMVILKAPDIPWIV